jgi:hypothetical protein
MIQTDQETILSLSRAARSLPSRSGKRGVSTSTIWRWCARGIRGIRLETILIGGIRYTSAEALQRFFSATTAAADGTAISTATPISRQRAIAAAERELSEAGM